MANVELVHWNPWRPQRVSFGKYRTFKFRVSNFGDLLGPLLVKKLLAEQGICRKAATTKRRLLTVGSVMLLARNGDTVWGTGVNGKSLQAEYKFTELDIRAVRGPLTADFLRKRGLDVPDVYGDPGLLVSHIAPRRHLPLPKKPSSVVYMPNMHDAPKWTHLPGCLSPQMPLKRIAASIANAELVIASSLHAIVLADSYGIPSQLVRSQEEPMFKYEDYFLGTGRTDWRVADTPEHARRLGGEEPTTWDSKPLLAAFPVDLWQT